MASTLQYLLNSQRLCSTFFSVMGSLIKYGNPLPNELKAVTWIDCKNRANSRPRDSPTPLPKITSIPSIGCTRRLRIQHQAEKQEITEAHKRLTTTKISPLAPGPKWTQSFSVHGPRHWDSSKSQVICHAKKSLTLGICFTAQKQPSRPEWPPWLLLPSGRRQHSTISRLTLRKSMFPSVLSRSNVSIYRLKPTTMCACVNIVTPCNVLARIVSRKFCQSETSGILPKSYYQVSEWMNKWMNTKSPSAWLELFDNDCFWLTSNVRMQLHSR